MKVSPNEVINSFLKEKREVFTSEDFCSYMRENGLKISTSQCEELLNASDFVFSLINKEYITRAGVFSGRWFSFCPSKEEVEKGRFIIGHRCIPFSNPEISPDNIFVISKKKTVDSDGEYFSMNLAMDSFAMFGEGYVIPYIINDKSNEEYTLASVQYSMPTKIKLTSWAFSDIENGDNFEYGDRILCRIVDWESSVVEMTVLKKATTDLIVTHDDIERNQWYSDFEKELLSSINRHGPASSIEEQLALFYLENGESFCSKSCGSVEELLVHTDKIAFEPYGVENRIWKAGESVPYVGEWNKNIEKELIMVDLSLVMTPQIIDCFIKNDVYCHKNLKKQDSESSSVENFLCTVFPNFSQISKEERNIILLNIKKRRDILEKEYNPFVDYNVADIRRRAVELFSNVCSLLCSIGCSNANISDFPQQELVIVSQLFGHVVRLIDELEIEFNVDGFPYDDISLALDGMEETFEEVGGILKTSLEESKMKGFEILQDNS